MSQAEELLESITSESYSDNNVVVGADRFIYVPESLKRIAVQYDHNIETVTFDCPRYVDGHDMLGMQIYINYIRADGIRGSHLCTNNIADDTDTNVMHFDWTVSGHVTYADGHISFMVCVKKVDADGNEVVHWNSEVNTDMYVSPGIKHIDMTLAKYPDVIAQLIARVEALESKTATLTGEG